MERELSVEEKIRKAEEISARRNGTNGTYTNTINVSKNSDFYLLKKMIIQVLICLVIYFIFYLIQNTNYVFSASTISKTKEILEYDMDIEGIYENIRNNLSIDHNINIIKEENESQEIIENVYENAEVEVVDEETEKAEEAEKIEENLQLAENENTDEPNIESNEENMAEAIKEYATIGDEIKDKYSIIKPASGHISSEFGTREPEGDIVTPYHHGIDIAIVTGTEVKSAINGTVILSANSESYGKYIKVQDGDLITLYAHCSELLKNEGDEVGQGEVIALSGATGKVTGPHLHFEVIYKGEYVNPREVLNF